MSNLGAYQDFATDAKQLGGVESYLKIIEADAVASATPRLYARAVAATLIVVASLAAASLGANRWLKARGALASAAGGARQRLIAAAQQSVESAGGDHAHPGAAAAAESRTCSSCGRPGHDKRTCDIPEVASVCTVCGFHGHSPETCLWARQ